MKKFKVGDRVRVAWLPDDVKSSLLSDRPDLFKIECEILAVLPEDEDEDYEAFAVDNPDDTTLYYERELEFWALPVTPDELEATYASLGVTKCLPIPSSTQS